MKAHAKTSTLLIFFLIFFSLITQHSSLNTLFAQAPQKFNYQAVVRDGNTLLVDKTLDVKFEILQGSATGSVVWDETQTDVSTNSLGLLILKVGDANNLDVDWSSGPYYLKVQLNLKDGNGLREFGNVELLSVPYALHATEGIDADADPANELQTLTLTGTNLAISDGNTQDMSALINDADADVSNEIQDLVLSGDELTLSMDPTPVTIDLSSYSDNPWTINGASDDTLLFGGSVAIGSGMPGGSKLAVQGDNIADEKALFEVKRQDGQTVFAVYNSGVRMYVEEGEEAKSRKGGFAIGGFTPGKGETGKYFLVSPDSVRIYLDTATAKRRKGGFAIGGYTPGKGMGQEYLRVTEDSTRIYIDNTATKRSKGGFAIGGFTPGKGPATDFMNMSPDNYFIGHESGKSITSGLYNSFMGYQAGINTKEGANNIFLGFNAGYNNTGSSTDTRFGSHNIFLGNESGFNNDRGYRNVYIGYRSGYNSIFSYNNTFVGYNSGQGNTSGYSNVFVGDDAGRSNTSGFYNTFVGSQSGFFNTTGVFNTFLGYATGKANATGNYNVFIGKESGTMNTTGSFNVFMGNESGMYNVGGS
ncbi:MAG: hypothetical protein U9N53_06880, partial [Bacteroidota bacterium]|nr:hypothetical protein [Bacteroidota bacterium]